MLLQIGAASHLQGTACGLLQGVCNVCGDRAASISHQNQVARVHHKVAVAKHVAPLAHQDVRVACTCCC